MQDKSKKVKNKLNNRIVLNLTSRKGGTGVYSESDAIVTALVMRVGSVNSHVPLDVSNYSLTASVCTCTNKWVWRSSCWPGTPLHAFRGYCEIWHTSASNFMQGDCNCHRGKKKVSVKWSWNDILNPYEAKQTIYYLSWVRQTILEEVGRLSK